MDEATSIRSPKTLVWILKGFARLSIYMSLIGLRDTHIHLALLISCRELQGPTWGYPTEGAYYRDASSSDALLAVRIPLFALHAEDDPVSHRSLVQMPNLP